MNEHLYFNSPDYWQCSLKAKKKKKLQRTYFERTNATQIQSSGQKGCLPLVLVLHATRADLFSTPFLISCACGQIPLAKSNGAGNWSGCETISNGGSAGADEQWLCDIPSPAQCASHNWKAFVIWLPFDYDVQDVNPNRTGGTAAEEHAHIEFPGFISQFRCARLLVSRKQYLTVPSLTLWAGKITQRGGKKEWGLGSFYLCTFFAIVSFFCTSPVRDRLWSPETLKQTTKLPEGYEHSNNTPESTASKFINNTNRWNLGQCVPGVSNNWRLCLEFFFFGKKSSDCVRVSCFRDWSTMKCERFPQISVSFCFSSCLTDQTELTEPGRRKPAVC